MFDALADRVTAVEASVVKLAEAVDKLAQGSLKLAEGLLPKDLSPELYGSEPDHAADREARAALLAKRRDR
jgi:hypothetical protein